LIHASKKPDEDAMRKFGFETLPCGFIVGKATLVDVKKYENEEEHRRDAELHLADDGWGRFGFVLENIKRIKPVSASGKLGFWEFENEL